MSEVPSDDLCLEFEPIGRSGRIRLVAKFPSGTDFTDKFDVTNAREREACLERLAEGREGLDRAEIRSALERIASEVASSSSKADGSDGDDETVPGRLVQLAKEHYRLGRTPANDPFAVAREGPQIARMIRGGSHSLRAELARDYWRKYDRVANGSSLADALLVIQGEACEAEAEPVHLRVAPYEDGIVLDLGDKSGRVVVVDSGGWRAEDQSPVLFRRTELTGALPVPEAGGSLDEFRDLVNVTDETWPLFVGFLVASFFTDISHPIALMGGQQGSGKSTGAELLAGVIDPGPAVLRTPPRDVEQWVLNASGSWMVAIDNVSRISEWWSDALCRAATGDGLVRRRLFTDEELSVLSFRRVVLLTSIDVGALKGDLGDRILLLDLEPISSRKREYEKTLRSRYRAAHPRILGALLDLLARVLAALPEIELEEKSRLADFNRVLAAVDRILGMDSLGIYLGQRDRVAEDVVESDPVAEAVRKLAVEEGQWSGTASELLQRLAPADPPRGWPPKGWPKSGRGLSGALRRALPALGQLGIEVVPPSDTNRDPTRSRDRIFTIRLFREKPQTTVRTVQPSETGSGGAGNEIDARTVAAAEPSDRPHDRPKGIGPDGLERADSDGSDGLDGPLRHSSGYEEDEDVVE